MAVTDAPANCFVAELQELYPEAEVICVNRDRKRWWLSWKSVSNSASQGFLSLLLLPVPGKRWYSKLVAQFQEL